MTRLPRTKSAAGFSMIELLVAIAIIGVIAAIAVPETTRTVGDMRLRNDARALHNMVALGKMRAASRFTRERLFVDLSSESFFLQWWDKSTNAWVNEGSVTQLSSGIDFGFGSIAAPPPNTQDSIGQSAPCKDSGGADIANTACVVFNSRGIPIDPLTGAPTGNTAFYVTDGTGVYGTTLTATPLIRLWWSPGNTTAWAQR